MKTVSIDVNTKAFGTYDFETYAWVNPLCFGLHTETESEFYINRNNPDDVAKTCLEAMEHIAYENDVKQWWAHNGGKFDVLFLIYAMKQMKGWRCDGAVASGRVISLRVMSPRVAFELKDSYAVIQSGLAKALTSFEIPMKKVFTEEDYQGLDNCKGCADRAENDKHHTCMLKHSDAKLEKGCLADCESLHLLLQKASGMFADWGGQMKSTFSSSALTVVKASLGKDLPSHEGQQHFNAMCRKAYKGGRVEVLRHAPQEKQREYDFTSSYPWSMTQTLPWDLLGQGSPREDALSIIEATVTVPAQYIPPLPYVPKGGGLYFPIGTFTGWFTMVELGYAIEKCGVTAVLHDCINYTIESPFQDFIAKVFETKAKSVGALREFCKLIMNGCYGKFGQKPENTKLKVFSSREDAIQFERTHACEQVSGDGTALSVAEFRWPKQTHYALASTITAYSRCLLHESLLLANKPSYCDTDSIHCIPTPALDNKVNAKLGGLQMKHDGYTACFYAPKLYRLRVGNPCPCTDAKCKKPHNVYASKGFPVSADAFERIVLGESVGNPKGRMQLVKTQLRTGSAVIHLGEDETQKVWSGNSNKRKLRMFSPDGDTQPWHIRELLEGKHHAQRSPIAVRETDTERLERGRRKKTR